MTTISILGCGWLGIPLAERLIADGFAVNGSTTSQTKRALLESKQIRPFVFSLEPDGIEGGTTGFFDADVLIVDIPPRFHFSRKIAALVPHIESSRVEKVLLTSSVSVFGQRSGTLTESSIPEITTDKSLQLFAAENLLRENPHFQTTILRFGGLVGPNRHPVRYLAGQPDLENPDAPVNLIHLQDCIGMIRRIVETETWGEILHGVAPHHPARAQYYTQKALEFGLVPPQFNRARASEGKVIDATRTQQRLDYTFAFPEL